MHQLFYFSFFSAFFCVTFRILIIHDDDDIFSVFSVSLYVFSLSLSGFCFVLLTVAILFICITTLFVANFIWHRMIQ